MDPNVWGRHMWASIHFISLAYPTNPSETDKATFKNYFEQLHKVLPCQKCSQHLNETMRSEHPLYANHLSSKHELFKWTVELHNIVNKRLGKKTISVDDAYDIYMKKSNFAYEMCKEHIDNKTNLDTDDIQISSLTRLVVFLLIALFVCIILLIYCYYFFIVTKNK